MANTTNYNWETPDDTDLVKDGAAAIRTLGSSIDTTVFNNANAAIAKTIVDAKGDIIAATAADTVSRLAVGANDTVLTADSSTATGLKWASAAAGGMTSIASGTLSGSSVSITSIPNTYEQLLLKIYNPYITTGSSIFQLTLNNNTTANQYTTYSGVTNLDDSSSIRLNVANDTLNNLTTSYPAVVIALENYTSTTSNKVGHLYFYNGVSGDRTFLGWGFKGANTSAISSIQIKTSASTFAGGTYTLWGVK